MASDRRASAASPGPAAPVRSRLRRGSRTRLLGVTLGAQPRDAALAVHPLVDFRFAFETRDLNRCDPRAFGHDIPVAFGNSNGFESYSRFGHTPLCQQFELKSNGPIVPAPRT